MKDEFKRTNSKDYTSWDLGYVKDNHGKEQRLEKKFRRKARRKMKQMLDKSMKECYN